MKLNRIHLSNDTTKLLLTYPDWPKYTTQSPNAEPSSHCHPIICTQAKQCIEYNSAIKTH